uniref:Uncharacterized protein n=1 Tax=Timema poppense TaxID=170557 RepID=A0A7R9CNV9_TIMPO|nr:unnamed protein product [Timema poppensis]
MLSYDDDKKSKYVLTGKSNENRSRERLNRRWEENIRIDLKETGFGEVDWIELAQDRDRRPMKLIDIVSLVQFYSNLAEFRNTSEAVKSKDAHCDVVNTWATDTLMDGICDVKDNSVVVAGLSMMQRSGFGTQSGVARMCFPLLLIPECNPLPPYRASTTGRDACSQSEK